MGTASQPVNSSSDSGSSGGDGGGNAGRVGGDAAGEGGDTVGVGGDAGDDAGASSVPAATGSRVANGVVPDRWMDDQDRDSRLQSQTARVPSAQRRGRRDAGFSVPVGARFGRFPTISAGRDSRIAKLSSIIRELQDCRLIPAHRIWPISPSIQDRPRPGDEHFGALSSRPGLPGLGLPRLALPARMSHRDADPPSAAEARIRCACKCS